MDPDYHPQYKAYHQISSKVEGTMSRFAAQVLNRKTQNQEVPRSLVITRSTIVAPSAAFPPAVTRNGKGSANGVETITGAVNGVPSTLNVATDGGPWLPIT